MLNDKNEKYQTAQNIPIVRLCRVIDAEDDGGGDRIKVRLLPEDSNKDIDEIQYAHPFLPKMLYVKPKKDEYVFILNCILGDGNSTRLYIGPVNPFIGEIYESTSISTGNMFRKNYYNENASKNQKINAASNGAFPENEDISIVGRKNCDIRVKDNEVLLTSGVKRTYSDNGGSVPSVFNDSNDHAFISLRYNETPDKYDSYHSTATIVADRINLIGNKSSNASLCFDTNDTEKLITDDEMKTIIKKAHVLPYGDVLVDILTKFFDVFLNHKHKWLETEPDYNNELKTLDLIISNMPNTALSENVRIN